MGRLVAFMEHLPVEAVAESPGSGGRPNALAQTAGEDSANRVKQIASKHWLPGSEVSESRLG